MSVFKFSNLLTLLILFVLATGNRSWADVNRWDIDIPVPGTAGIELTPGVQLRDRELEFAHLGQRDLKNADFSKVILVMQALSSRISRERNLKEPS